MTPHDHETELRRLDAIERAAIVALHAARESWLAGTGSYRAIEAAQAAHKAAFAAVVAHLHKPPRDGYGQPGQGATPGLGEGRFGQGDAPDLVRQIRDALASEGGAIEFVEASHREPEMEQMRRLAGGA